MREGLIFFSFKISSIVISRMCDDNNKDDVKLSLRATLNKEGNKILYVLKSNLQLICVLNLFLFLHAHLSVKVLS